ncbi:MAG TPA: copper amine oxidase N-terminal domain-containing protein, partial [Symbiobacteriaceae bacterium]|nr:copper amine oxidase N-terminal domain-containing protein [Symbiobacteriaceae bacterium]
MALSDLAEALAAQVTWDHCLQTATLTRNDRTLTLGVGKADMHVQGETRPLLRAPAQFEGQLIIPLRPVAEALGARVDWDPERYRALMSM